MAVNLNNNNQPIMRVFGYPPHIPNKLMNKFRIANDNIYSKNKLKNVIKIGIPITRQICQVSGKRIKCFHCPIADNGFGICKEF